MLEIGIRGILDINFFIRCSFKFIGTYIIVPKVLLIYLILCGKFRKQIWVNVNFSLYKFSELMYQHFSFFPFMWIHTIKLHSFVLKLMIKIYKIRFRIALFKYGKMFGSLNYLTIAGFYWRVYLIEYKRLNFESSAKTRDFQKYFGFPTYRDEIYAFMRTENVISFYQKISSI